MSHQLVTAVLDMKVQMITCTAPTYLVQYYISSFRLSFLSPLLWLLPLLALSCLEGLAMVLALATELASAMEWALAML